MKKIKMCLYGEPGVGKSVFAINSPKPFFICSDGNYAWLEDFGADPNAHADVQSWEEAKKILKNKELLDNYETIVIDLLEDMFKWAESEFCVKNRIEHVSDIGYGKGYDITRNEFFIEISKVLAMDKNVILIMHGTHEIVKDRRGVEKTKFIPSPRLPDKVLDMIEGRVRYFLRCYLKSEETKEGTLVKKRYLSIVPKENEFGICRGINEDLIPHDIPLDWKEFTKVIGFDNSVTKVVKEEVNEIIKPVKEEVKKEEVKLVTQEELEGKTLTLTDLNPMPFDTVNEPVLDTVNETMKEAIDEEPVKEEISSSREPEKVETKEETKVEEKPLSNADKIAAIKAKLAAMKANNK